MWANNIIFYFFKAFYLFIPGPFQGGHFFGEIIYFGALDLKPASGPPSRSVWLLGYGVQVQHQHMHINVNVQYIISSRGRGDIKHPLQKYYTYMRFTVHFRNGY